MINRFEHLVLTVSDVGRAVAFYQRVLGLTAVDSDQVVACGTQTIIYFQLLGQEIRHHALEGAGSVCFTSDWSIDQVRAHLMKESVLILDEVLSDSLQSSLFINDPDNNLIEIRALNGAD